MTSKESLMSKLESIHLRVKKLTLLTLKLRQTVLYYSYCSMLHKLHRQLQISSIFITRRKNCLILTRYTKKALQMVISCSVSKAKVIFTYSTDSRVSPIQDGVTLKHHGMPLLGDLTELLWLLALDVMACYQDNQITS